MNGSKGHQEFCFSLGFVRGYCSRVEKDLEELKWFQNRGVNLLDLRNLCTAADVVSMAFYENRPKEDPGCKT